MDPTRADGGVRGDGGGGDGLTTAIAAVCVSGSRVAEVTGGGDRGDGADGGVRGDGGGGDGLTTAIVAICVNRSSTLHIDGQGNGWVDCIFVGRHHLTFCVMSFNLSQLLDFFHASEGFCELGGAICVIIRKRELVRSCHAFRIQNWLQL